MYENGGTTKTRPTDPLVEVVAGALPADEHREWVAGGVVAAIRAAGYEIRRVIDFDCGE